MERLLYNGIAASTALDGTGFFYSNPLQLRTGHDGSHEDAPTQRLSWYSCACCPPNLARLMASLHSYVATGDQAGLQLHLYAAGTFRAGEHAVEVDTRYPWDEQITVSVTHAGPGPWTLALRVPAWCADVRLSVNGSVVGAGTQQGYLRLTRTWRAGDRVELTLAMPPRLVTAHPRVDAVRGTVALVRGPLVYCLEHADLPAALVLEDLELDATARIHVSAHADGIAPVTLQVTVRDRGAGQPALYRQLPAADEPPAATACSAASGCTSRPAGSAATVPAIPYFLWANRAPGPMRVWIPTAAREA
jgi:DUF1680 family protein